MTIQQIMRTVPGDQSVEVREYTQNEHLELATAQEHCEFLRNNCCVGFDRYWVVYGVSAKADILTIHICPPSLPTE